MQMHGIVSLLDESLSAQVRTVWDGLEKECGLAGIKVTPIPHFTWQIASDYDFPRLESVLRSIAMEAKPFPMRCSGLGVFTGEQPVLYIPIVRAEELSRFHRLVWERVWELSESPSPFYSPEAWMPHITLAHRDLDTDNLSCALGSLAVRAFKWEGTVDNLALVYQTEDQVGELRYRLNFAG
jgi:2'-5' RNA ligase